MSLNVQNRETVNTGGNFGIFYVIKGLLFSFILSLILLIPTAVLLKAFAPKDDAITVAAYVINFIGTLFFGIYTSRHVLKSGLLNGTLSGLLYFLILFFVGSLLSGGVHFSVSSLIAFIVSASGGALGGIFGINTVKPQRRR